MPIPTSTVRHGQEGHVASRPAARAHIRIHGKIVPAGDDADMEDNEEEDNDDDEIQFLGHDLR